MEKRYEADFPAQRLLNLFEDKTSKSFSIFVNAPKIDIRNLRTESDST